MTISISEAPAFIESIISFLRVAKEDSPAGNPVDTAAIGILSFKFFLACFTN